MQTGVMRRADTKVVETPVTGVAYISPDQQGGAYGTIKRCYFTFGAISSNGGGVFLHNQTVNTVVQVHSVGRSSTTWRPIPFVDYGSTARSIELSVQASSVNISTGTSVSLDLVFGWFDFV